MDGWTSLWMITSKYDQVIHLTAKQNGVSQETNNNPLFISKAHIAQAKWFDERSWTLAQTFWWCAQL